MDLRRLLILLAGVAAVVLALGVLLFHPASTVDLLAGAALAAGAGLIIASSP